MRALFWLGTTQYEIGSSAGGARALCGIFAWSCRWRSRRRWGRRPRRRGLGRKAPAAAVGRSGRVVARLECLKTQLHNFCMRSPSSLRSPDIEGRWAGNSTDGRRALLAPAGPTASSGAPLPLEALLGRFGSKREALQAVQALLAPRISGGVQSAYVAVPVSLSPHADRGDCGRGPAAPAPVSQLLRIPGGCSPLHFYNRANTFLCTFLPSSSGSNPAKVLDRLEDALPKDRHVQEQPEAGKRLLRVYVLPPPLPSLPLLLQLVTFAATPLLPMAAGSADGAGWLFWFACAYRAAAGSRMDGALAWRAWFCWLDHVPPP